MPEFTVQEALKIWQASENDRPFIVVSGAIGEEEAVALLKAGAHDFIRKDNLARLVPAIRTSNAPTPSSRSFMHFWMYPIGV